MASNARVLVIFGTRPEAIKLAPVIRALQRQLSVDVCVTAQHRRMLDQVLSVFEIVPDYDLDLMQPHQDLFDVTARALVALRPVLHAARPDLVMVQGDTSTTFAGALAAFYAGVPVAHIEAGLRTRDKLRPFPEEINRRLATALADWHFAPTAWARDNLLAEAVEAYRVFVTGNTGIDALFATLERLSSGALPVAIPGLSADDLDGRRIVLVTGHRRESFGAGFERICRALHMIADAYRDVLLVYPVHLNPNVRAPVCRQLGNHARVRLIEPVDYLPFVALMHRAEIILTDSGGVQEEAPSLGKPVLVMRDTTERPEGVTAGVARLVGTDDDAIVGSVSELLRDPAAYARMATRANPYGDGQAARRITQLTLALLNGAVPDTAVGWQ